MRRQQLRAIVYKIAVSYLEVERGLRPREQLAAFLSPAEYRRHLIMPPVSETAVGPVRPPDIARVRVDSMTPDRVRASALVRRADDRWSNLLVDLHQVGRGWQVTKLDRLERIVVREPRTVEVSEVDDARRVRSVQEERRLAMAAVEAIRARIDAIGDRRTRAARELRPELERWEGHVTYLTAELEALNTTQRLREQHGASMAPRSATADLADRGHETAKTLLGPRPDDVIQAMVWDQAAEALGAYCQKWALDEDAILGPVIGDEHAADRRQLLEHLRCAAHALDDHMEDVERADRLTLDPSLDLE